ncbi:unnamed protein product [Lymnaea stagnalis]|uniref:Protein tweety homolog n=1 Tax=Lymnaea stagnalis TaxID=6523 RepID=A0AAV2II62_LYMST
MATDPPERYSSQWISNFFHDFPHFDFKFNQVNSTFDPEKESYREALLTWALVPVAVCILLWLIFMFYFIVRACKQLDKSNARPSSCPAITTGLLLFLGVGLIGLCLYENENGHQSVGAVKSPAVEATTTFHNARLRIIALGSMQADILGPIYSEIKDALNSIPDGQLRNKSYELLEIIKKGAFESKDYLKIIKSFDVVNKTSDFIDLTNDIEYYRWVITIVMNCWYIFIFLMTMVGLLIRSRITLIVSAVIAVISSILIWVATGAYLGVSLGLGDLCTDPDTYFINLAEDPSDRNLTTAYIKCTDSSEPYQMVILDIQTVVTQTGTDLQNLLDLAAPYRTDEFNKSTLQLKNELQYCMGNLSTLLTDVGMCTNIHHQYITGVKLTCHDILSASSFLALTFCLLGIVCTLIIFTISCVWREYTKKSRRADYVPVDVTDPFLPHPPPYESDYGAMGNLSPRPWLERGTLQHTGSASNHDDQVLMLTHQHPLPDDSPPPAYHPGKYVRRYPNQNSAIRH